MADFLASLFKSYIKERGKEEGIDLYDKRFRRLCPGLHDFLKEYFDKELPWTERRRK